MSYRAAGCSAGFSCLPGPRRTILQLTWATAPQEFDGKPHGASVLYSLAWDDNAVIERGNYVSGKRHGLWVRSGMHEGEARTLTSMAWPMAPGITQAPATAGE